MRSRSPESGSDARRREPVARGAGRGPGRWRFWALQVALALATALIFERGYRALHADEERVQTYSDFEGIYVADPLLGFRPAADLVTTASLRIGSQSVYEVTYRTDADALRRTPSFPAGADCVLFFGGSFTFGEGVDDEQTLPWRFAELSGVAARNYGYSGYGPHQMLAAIEGGLVERSAHCRPRLAVYQAVDHHVLRAAGLWTWDNSGPRYEVDGDGRAVRAGSFADRERPVPEILLERLQRISPLARELGVGQELGLDAILDEDVELYESILRTARRELSERWPGTELVVVYWDVGQNRAWMPVFGPQSGLAEYGLGDLPVVPVSRILGAAADQEDFARRWLLYPDLHPGADAHDRIAAWLASHCVEGGAPGACQ